MPGNDIGYKMYVYGKIAVGAVMLVMQAVGIKVSVDKSTMERTVTRAAKAIRRSSAFKKAIREFTNAWTKAGNSRMKKAKLIFILVKNTHAAGFLGTIVKSLCFSMTKWDWVKTSLKVSGMMIAAFASEGLALIGNIALLVLGAVDLFEDIKEAIELE